LWFEARFPKATIYAVEPDADNFELMLRNVARSRNIVPVFGAVWGRRAELTVSNGAEEPWGRQVREASGASTVPGFTIDDLLARAGADVVPLVKIDIEGAEAHVFSGAADWLGRTPLLMIELHDWLLPWTATSRGFYGALGRYAFDSVTRRETMFCFRHPPQFAR
jgi:FkbM family methyltransferase